MPQQSRRYALVLAGLVITSLLVALTFVLQASTSPRTLFASGSGITVRFTTDKDQVLLPNSCVQLSWEVSGVDEVLVNDRYFAPQGQRQLCIQANDQALLSLIGPDGEAQEFGLPVTILLLEARLWVSIAAVLVLSLALAHMSGLPGLRSGDIVGLIQRHWLPLVILLYLLWAGFFIYQSSFIAIDGKRYYALFDDAMISMRYAHHLAEGHGLVWNPGEYVEGYTNLLMVLLMAVTNFVFEKRFAVLSTQLSGIVFVLLSAWLTMRIAERLLLRPDSPHKALKRRLFFVVPLLYYPLSFWSLMGMETGLLSLVFLLTLDAALRYTDTQRQSDLILMGFFAGCAYLTRPDAFVMIGPVYAFSLWRLWWLQRRACWRPVIIAAGITLAIVLAHLLFRLAYYGEMLPNTYILKISGIPLSARLDNGLGFVWPFLRSARGLLLIVLGGGLLGVLGWRLPTLQRIKLDAWLLITGILLLLVAYQIYAGGDPWPYWRMMTPGMPLALALMVVLLVDFGAQVRLPYRMGPLLASLVFVLCLQQLNQAFEIEYLFKGAPYDVWQAENNTNLALSLQTVTQPEARIGVILAGTLPYYLDRPAVDFLGKMDPYIAQLPPDLSGAVSWNGMESVPGHNKYDLDYSIRQLEPDYIQRCHWGRQVLCDWVFTRYTKRRFEGVELILLTTSPHIRWHMLDDQP